MVSRPHPPRSLAVSKPASSGELTALDLFAGAGGFTLGLSAAGFRSVAAVEIDEIAGSTWARNFPGGHLWKGKAGDMRKLDPHVVKRKLRQLGVTELDVITAGPPCQGFSRVGRGKLDSLADRSGAFFKDRRNVLYKNAIDFLRVLRPKAFIFENVAGMLHLRGTNVAEAVCRAVEDAGYIVKCGLLNSAWYGIPQARERVFIIGIRADLGIEPTLPAITHRTARRRGLISTATLSDATWERRDLFVPFADLVEDATQRAPVTVLKALGDLPDFVAHLAAQKGRRALIPRREAFPPVPYRRTATNEYASLMREWTGFSSTQVTDHFCRWTPRDFGTFRNMQEGDRYPQARRLAWKRWQDAKARAESRGQRVPRQAEFVPPYSEKGFPDKWRKLVRNQPSWTVTAHLKKDTYSHIHYDSRQARMITPREAARLQSFPDGFRFEGSTGDVFAQIGNAVPPLLARAVAAEVRSALLTKQARSQSRAA